MMQSVLVQLFTAPWARSPEHEQSCNAVNLRLITFSFVDYKCGDVTFVSIYTGGGVSAYTSQAIGGVMATGTQQQVISGIANYSQGQTVQIGNERYIITNQPQAGQFERMYVSGMSG